VWFAYTPDRKGEHPKAHLKQFTGTLQADAYAGFEQILRRRPHSGSGVLGAWVAQPFHSRWPGGLIGLAEMIAWAVATGSQKHPILLKKSVPGTIFLE
jgi:hypothetical protein